MLCDCKCIFRAAPRAGRGAGESGKAGLCFSTLSTSTECQMGYREAVKGSCEEEKRLNRSGTVGDEDALVLYSRSLSAF